ncbi:YkgJ family cysteine cluster protein [Desulfopila inferna]|uniref:YkgJ family cysteine cluster protein n=1 Tax=Desulfopila inferna TaxID=468528 RepID=UPI001F070D4C|nr:YkgJ family cysteine cluster protein [Desulfopila inferna]
MRKIPQVRAGDLSFPKSEFMPVRVLIVILSLLKNLIDGKLLFFALLPIPGKSFRQQIITIKRTIMDNVFLCSRCGFCCQGETTVSLNEKDQENMLFFLETTREEALKKYWRLTDGEVQMKTVNGHCIFFENGCTIHQARPWRCREWPLVKAILIDRNNLESISSSCPGLNREASYTDICRIIEDGGCLGSSTSDKKEDLRSEI